MDTKNPAPLTTSPTASLPPIADLFKQALDLLIAQGGRLVILWLYSVLTYIVAFVAAVLLIIAFAVYLAYVSGISRLNDYTQLLEMPSALIFGGVLFLLFVIAMSVIGLVYNAALILLVSDEKKEKTPWIHFKQGLQFAWPLFFTGLIVGFFIVGGLFFFFVPYIIFTVAFGFYTYTVVLEKKKGMDAVRFSAALVFQQFWPILLRLVVLWVAYFLISAGISALFASEGSAETMAGILQMIVSVFLTMYSVSYMYVLYRQVRQSYVEKPMSLKWVWVIALLGWTVLVIGGFFAIRALNNEYQERRNAVEQQKKFQEQYRQEMQLQEEEFDQLFEEFPPENPLSPPVAPELQRI